MTSHVITVETFQNSYATTISPDKHRPTNRKIPRPALLSASWAKKGSVYRDSLFTDKNYPLNLHANEQLLLIFSSCYTLLLITSRIRTE